MRSSNTKLSSDVEEKRARIADESRQRRLSEEAHRRTLQREHTACAPRLVAPADGASSIFGTFITAIIAPSLQTARAGEVGVRLREIEVGW